MSFTFVDLFAGIGGFHAALFELGGRCVLASEIDSSARNIYELNWGGHLQGEFNDDVQKLSGSRVGALVPEHDVLCAGFPCQPFSKSGYQRGIGESRGTLFFDIARIIEAKRPRVVILENVRNLIGPRHYGTWTSIRSILRSLGYVLTEEPIIFSPHLLPFERGGRPQVRERIFIVAVHHGRGSHRLAALNPVPRRPVDGWNPHDWDLRTTILDEVGSVQDPEQYALSSSEIEILSVWDDFLKRVGKSSGRRLPGFPIWASEFKLRQSRLNGLPEWKQAFIRQNHSFFIENRSNIASWLARHPEFKAFPQSRKKFEWQAGSAESLWDCLIQFRPSGIRVRPATYVPALVAMNQTSVFGPEKRRLSLREAQRLQGFPESFSFGRQPSGLGFKQLGNAVSVGVVTHVLRECAANWSFFPADLRDEFLK